MTEIWFIRHGETDWNRQRRLQGWQDIPLNEAGRQQAAATARMRDRPSRRASTPSTAAICNAPAIPPARGRAVDLRIRTEPGIRERGFGVLEGLDLEHIDTLAPAAAASWKSRDPLRPLDGGETLGQFQSRVISTVDDIAARHGGERIMLFTHGGVLDIVWRHASGVPLNARATRRC